MYPSSSSDVFERALREGGAVVSLEPWGSPPRRYAFPKRNRVIAGLSRCVFIAEAGERSGTLGTALAADQIGRGLYAVPGSIFSPESAGANRLISEGASVICSERDLELRISMDYGALRLVGEDSPQVEGRLLSALVGEPLRADDLARHLGEPVTGVLCSLADYESRGIVERLRDGRYSLSSDAYLTRARMDG